ncbi:MAG: hypothetical protein SGJ18_06520 [Pseudomonadota bacterium]|nr:hypothetical protein [Pseudomonadota bacterium]
MTKERKLFLYFSAVHLVALSLVMLSIGCATANKSAGFGGAIGAGTGALLGGIADPGKNGEYRTRNVFVGATLGGMAGLITGSVIHKEMDEQKKEAFLKGRASSPPQQAGVMPSLTQAKVRTEWIESRVSGNRFVEGHFEYVIEEPSRWDR